MRNVLLIFTTLISGKETKVGNPFYLVPLKNLLLPVALQPSVGFGRLLTLEMAPLLWTVETLSHPKHFDLLMESLISFGPMNPASGYSDPNLLAVFFKSSVCESCRV